MSISATFKNSFYLGLITLLFTLSSVKEAHASLGAETLQPLNIRSQSFFHALRLNNHMQDANGLSAGQTEVSVYDDISSTWANSDNFVMDLNMNDLRVDLRQGLAHGWNITLSLSERRVMNTHLDQPTISFHKALGLGQDGRLDVAKNRTVIAIAEHGIYEDDFNHMTLSRPIELALSKRLFNNERAAILVSVNTQLETSNSQWSEKNNLDVALQVDARYNLNNTALFASVAYSWLQQDDFLGLLLNDRLFMVSVGAAWAIGERSAINLQYQMNEGAVENMGELSDVNHEISLGYQWQSQHWQLEMAVTENLLTFYNSPDIAFHGGVTYRI